MMKKVVRGIGLIACYIGLHQAFVLFFSLLAALIGLAENFRGINISFENDVKALLRDMGVFMQRYMYVAVAAAAVAAFFAYIGLGALRRRPLRAMLLTKPLTFKTGVAAVLFAVGVRAFVNVYYIYASKIPGLFAPYERAMETANAGWQGPYYLATMFLSAVVVAPLFEELLFRGIVMFELRRFLPDRAATLVQAVLFGALHILIFQAVFAFFAGVIFGAIYLRTKSLAVACAAHIVFNLTGQAGLRAADAAGYVPVNAALCVLLIAAGFLLIRENGEDEGRPLFERP